MKKTWSDQGKPSLEGLHVLVDDNPIWPCTLAEQARAACAGGAAVVQLRTKHTTDKETLKMALNIRQWTRDTGISFIINDRFDLALACEADGVHLGQTDLPPASIPSHLRNQLQVGRSTHTIDQARIALEEGVDYVAFGPVFSTESKDSSYLQRGLPLLEEIVHLSGIKPVVAIGGITLKNLNEILSTGARGAAVISAMTQAASPQQAVQDLSAVFQSHLG